MDVLDDESVAALEEELLGTNFSKIEFINRSTQPSDTTKTHSIFEHQTASIKLKANLDALSTKLARDLNDQLKKLEKYEQKLDYRIALAKNDSLALKRAQAGTLEQIQQALSQPEIEHVVSKVTELSQRQQRLKDIQSILERAAKLDEVKEMEWLQLKVSSGDIQGYNDRLNDLESLGLVYNGTHRQHGFYQFLEKAKLLNT